MRARRVERLVIHAERHVRVLEERVRREHRVVRLDDRVQDLRRRRDGEREIRLAAVVDREALEEEREIQSADLDAKSLMDFFS